MAVTHKNTHFSTFEQCFHCSFISSSIDTCQGNFAYGAWDDDSRHEGINEGKTEFPICIYLICAKTDWTASLTGISMML